MTFDLSLPLFLEPNSSDGMIGVFSFPTLFLLLNNGFTLVQSLCFLDALHLFCLKGESLTLADHTLLASSHSCFFFLIFFDTLPLITKYFCEKLSHNLTLHLLFCDRKFKLVPVCYYWLFYLVFCSSLPFEDYCFYCFFCCYFP